MSAKMRDLMALSFFLDKKGSSSLQAEEQSKAYYQKIMECPVPSQKGITKDIRTPKLRE